MHRSTLQNDEEITEGEGRESIAHTHLDPSIFSTLRDNLSSPLTESQKKGFFVRSWRPYRGHMKSPYQEAQKWQKESSLGAKFAVTTHPFFP